MPGPNVNRFFDILCPPVVDTCNEIDGLLASSGQPADGMEEMHERVIDALQEHDWINFDLPDYGLGIPGYEIGEKYIVPKEYAEQLIDLAFNDARALIILSYRHLVKHPRPEDQTLGQILRRSKSLLDISRVSDTDKSTLLNSLSLSSVNPPVPGYVIEEELGFKLEGSPLVSLTDEQGNLSLDWCPLIKNWIRTMSQIAEGCPANKKVIETPSGEKKILIRYFWDSLIQAMYE